MRELGLRVQIDPVGNIFGWRDGLEDLPPVMTGSHIDTVATGGRYDGNYGVLAGLSVVQALNTAGVTTRHPLVVACSRMKKARASSPTCWAPWSTPAA
jgi:N-carbamoyl-L-amino-acid hydrolase